MCFTKLRFFWILTSPDAKCGFHDLLPTTKKNLVKIPVNHGALPVNKPVYKSGQISGSKFQPRFNPPFIYFPIKINSMIVLFVAARHFSFDFFYYWFIKKYSKRKFREIFQQKFSWVVKGSAERCIVKVVLVSSKMLFTTLDLAAVSLIMLIYHLCGFIIKWQSRD